jgi:hypothetical protein
VATELVFDKDHSVVVTADVEAVKNDIENNGQGRPLLTYEVYNEKDSAGNPLTIQVNWAQIAYIREPPPRRSGKAQFM